jgi:uncharacterized membrane protein
LKPNRWLAIVLSFTILTLLATYFLQTEPLIYIRYVLSFVFVVFLPGYCLVNVLFLGKNKIDIFESLVLSVALSFGLAGLIGLFLGLSPVGINFTSITVSLSVTVAALSVIAFIRKSKEETLPVLQVQSPKQVSS